MCSSPSCRTIHAATGPQVVLQGRIISAKNCGVEYVDTTTTVAPIGPQCSLTFGRAGSRKLKVAIQYHLSLVRCYTAELFVTQPIAIVKGLPHRGSHNNLKAALSAVDTTFGLCKLANSTLSSVAQSRG